LYSPANNRWDRAVDGAQRFAGLVERLSAEPGVTAPDGSSGRKFGSIALKVDGAIFAMLSGGDVVLKLPADRVRALVDAGTCAPFDAGKGRPMREWAVVVDPAADELLAEEALAFVRH
jgi:hypothetical protein